MKKSIITLFSLWLLVSTASATTYYVDATNGDDDNNTGLSDAQAWKTISKVNNFSFSPSDDVYFKAGERWQEALKVDWNGTLTDRTVIGSYYMKDGIETVGVPSGVDRPTIRGAYPLINTTGAVPSGQYKALVEVAANYVTVQNIRAENSSGTGIQLNAKNAYNNAIFENNEVSLTAGSGMLFMRTSHDNIMRNNTLSGCATAWSDEIWPSHTWPVCNGAVGSYNNVIVGNFVHSNYGESIVTFDIGAYNNLISGNIISLIRGVGVYIDNSKDNVVENNMVIGDSSTRKLGSGIAMSVEDYPIFQNSTGNLIRNNLIASTSNCFWLGMENAARKAGRLQGVKILGNTCINATQDVRVTFPAANLEELVLENNIFKDIIEGAAACNIPTGSFTVRYNYWDQPPADTDCSNTNDVISTLSLNKTSGWDDISATKLPTVSDFTPRPQSSVIGAGVANASLKVDYNGNQRSLPPSLGALDIAVTSPSVVTLPYYMNVGGGQLGPLASGKTFLAEAHQVKNSSAVSFTGSISDAINATLDDALYQSWRGNNGSMMWSIPIENGSYDLILLYQEPYWGVQEGNCTAEGSNRQFDVKVENELVRDEFDICALAGAPLTSVRDEIPAIKVTDGQLDIQLSLGQGQDPKPSLMGLEITSSVAPPKAPVNLIVN